MQDGANERADHLFLEVLANGLQLDACLDPERGEDVGVSDTRELEQGRCRYRSCTEDDLFPRRRVVDRARRSGGRRLEEYACGREGQTARVERYLCDLGMSLHVSDIWN